MMTIYSDILHRSGIAPIFDPVIDLDIITELTFYLIARGFHRTFTTSAACQQRTLTPSETWSCPILGFASVLMLKTISPELVFFPDFWVSNIHRYSCFASKNSSDNNFAYSLGHLILSHFGTWKCSNVETNLSWTCLVSGLLSFEHPSVLVLLKHKKWGGGGYML